LYEIAKNIDNNNKITYKWRKDTKYSSFPLPPVSAMGVVNRDKCNQIATP
jgi:hypothetical protein